MESATASPAASSPPATSEQFSRGPWALALARLRRNRAAVAAASALGLIVAISLAAPLYAEHVAEVDPNRSNVNGTTMVGGEEVEVIAASESGFGSEPIGPTLEGHYFLGADAQGRDVAARILYGGRTSLLIAFSAALLTTAIGLIVGLAAGLIGGVVDGLISRLLDLLWAFPVYLLAICLSTVLLTQSLELGPIEIDSGSLLLPIVIIGVVFIPYLARAVRAEVLTLRHREFIDAAVSLGASRRRLIFKELLPNVLPVVLTFMPLIAAAQILAEAALSFLSIGVQPPDSSWGTMIADGQALLYTRPWISIVPGLLIATTTLCLTVLGDATLEALDPRRGADASTARRGIRRLFSREAAQ
jgi:peptide/nickel transport system permease protein